MKKGKSVILTLLISLSMLLIFYSNTEYSTATLNKFKSYSELKEFLQKQKLKYPRDLYPIVPALRPLSETKTANIESFDYSTTNIQVEGVDEADIVKTDGEYLYIISGRSVVIVKAYPPEEAAVVAKINVKGTLKQLFINNDRLVIFHQGGLSNEAKMAICIYDVSYRDFPTLKREVIVEGRYFTSRMIGDYVYAIVMRDVSIVNDEVELPKLCFNGKWRETPATKIYYSNMADYAYTFTTIVAVNVHEDWQEPAYGSILLGATSNVYVSTNNIYLAISAFGETHLHRIHIEEDKITYVANGRVPGRVLNQFSMDEYSGHFRIATTNGGRNSLYVLDMDLKIVGALEDIAPNERIYSARFMGNICYLVTFRNVDPFFVIDLSDPYAPKVLGMLKVSGYSDYLHPYDENYVIGVGKETVPAEGGEFSWYQGVKISLFDVTDVYSPKEIAKYVIGDRGTDSPVLRDHKAFLFDKEKNLLVIPVLVADVNESAYSGGVPPYVCGEPVWQGAYVFTISLTLEEKIVLRGTVTHVENSNVQDSAYHITRAIYIDEFLYTISESKIKINSLLDLSEIKELNIKA